MGYFAVIVDRLRAGLTKKGQEGIQERIRKYSKYVQIGQKITKTQNQKWAKVISSI